MARIEPTRRVGSGLNENISPPVAAVAPASPFAIEQPVAPAMYPPTVLEDLFSVDQPPQQQVVTQEDIDNYLGVENMGPEISRVYSQNPITGEVELIGFHNRVGRMERINELLQLLIAHTTESDEELDEYEGDVEEDSSEGEESLKKWRMMEKLRQIVRRRKWKR